MFIIIFTLFVFVIMSIWIAIFIWQHSIIAFSLAIMVDDFYGVVVEGGVMMMIRR